MNARWTGYCVAKAEECELMAQEETAAHLAGQWEEMAEHWRLAALEGALPAGEAAL